MMNRTHSRKAWFHVALGARYNVVVVPARLTLALSIFVSLSAFAWEGRLAHVERTLRGGELPARVDAAERLGDLRGEGAAALVTLALEDEAIEVRLAAAESAGRLGAAQALPTLVAWLTADDERVRGAAVRAISRIDSPDARQALARALLDPSPSVRLAVLDGVDADGDLVGPVATCLEDADSNVRAAGARALGRGADPRSLFSLIGALSDEVPLVRLSAVRALTDLGEPEAASSLVGLVADPDPSVRSATVYALGALGGGRQEGELIEALEAGEMDARRAALSALGAIGGEASVPVVARFVRHETLRVPAREAARRLARDDAMRLSMARALLSEASEARSENELQDLAYVLTELTREGPIPALGDEIRSALEESPLDRASLVRALGHSGAPGALVPLLLELGRGSDERSVALEALESHFARLGPDGRALEPIVDVLSSLRGEDERRAVALLGEIGDPRSAPLVLARLGSNEPATVRSAANALGRFAGPRVEAALLELVTHADAETRAAAARSIVAQSRQDLLVPLVALLGRPAPTDRLTLLEAIGGLLARGDLAGLDETAQDEVVAALEGRVRGHDEALASAAVDALGRGPGRALEAALLRATRHPTVAIRVQALRALGSHPSTRRRRVARLLLHVDQDRRSREATFAALARLGDAREARDALDAVRSERGRVAQAASYALHELARRGAIGERHRAELCELAVARDPIVRANLLLAATHAGVRCEGLERLRDGAENELVREAAASALAPPEVSERDELDILAFDPIGGAPLRKKSVVIVFEDGSALPALTDPRGRVRLSSVARGSLRLHSPSDLSLEP